jgi:predicted DNA-binding transcriptional regulator AlpA
MQDIAKQFTTTEPTAELVALRRFRADLGVVPSTCWRWIKRGWLPQPINIGGRLYLTGEQIAEFKRRALAGEFSASIKPKRATTN